MICKAVAPLRAHPIHRQRAYPETYSTSFLHRSWYSFVRDIRPGTSKSQCQPIGPTPPRGIGFIESLSPWRDIRVILVCVLTSVLTCSIQAGIYKLDFIGRHVNWRKGWDSNPRWVSTRSISSRVP